MKTRIFDLEDRLVNFAVSILKLSQSLPKDFAGNHTGNQLVRSGISPALNYGEAHFLGFQQLPFDSIQVLHSLFYILRLIRFSGFPKTAFHTVPGSGLLLISGVLHGDRIQRSCLFRAP